MEAPGIAFLRTAPSPLAATAAFTVFVCAVFSPGLIAVAADSEGQFLAGTGVRMQRVDLEHFILWSERELSEKDLYETRQDLLNVRREVGKAFGMYFPRHRFNVVLSREDTFRNYSGTPKHVAGLFDGTIHLPIAAGADRVRAKAILYHEYTHALIWLASAGKCPSWVHEGFAVDQEERVQPKRVLDPAQLLVDGRLRWRLEELEGRMSPLSGDPAEAGEAYSQAFAVIRYLRSRYSPADLLRWIRGMEGSGWEKSAERALALTPERMERQTAAFLAS